MNPAFGFQQVGRKLAEMTINKKCTLELLDKPPVGWPHGVPYRNLAREWIAVNAVEWKVMNGEEPAPVPVREPVKPKLERGAPAVRETGDQLADDLTDVFVQSTMIDPTDDL